jgi:hypothetical protein
MHSSHPSPTASGSTLMLVQAGEVIGSGNGPSRRIWQVSLGSPFAGRADVICSPRALRLVDPSRTSPTFAESGFAQSELVGRGTCTCSADRHGLAANKSQRPGNPLSLCAPR